MSRKMNTLIAKGEKQKHFLTLNFTLDHDHDPSPDAGLLIPFFLLNTKMMLSSRICLESFFK